MYFNQLLLHKRSLAPLGGEKLGQFCGPVKKYQNISYVNKETLYQYAECFLHVFTVLYYHSLVSVDIVKLVSDYKIIEASTGRGVVTETAHGWRCLCVMVGPSEISFYGAQHPWWRCHTKFVPAAKFVPGTSSIRNPFQTCLATDDRVGNGRSRRTT